MKKSILFLLFMFISIMANAQIIKGDMNDDGELSITDVMSLIDIILGKKPIVYFYCPDENHPHAIDLGLPSGTIWACCNVDATKPEEYGGLYQWGQTDENSSFDGVSTGNNIIGTNYDVAHVKWRTEYGSEWQMPSFDQILELIQNCSYMWTTINGINGGRFIGPNGSSIFLPASGYKDGSNICEQGQQGIYRTGITSDYVQCSYYLFFNNERDNWNDAWRYNKYKGMSVRPVCK